MYGVNEVVDAVSLHLCSISGNVQNGDDVN